MNFPIRMSDSFHAPLWPPGAMAAEDGHVFIIEFYFISLFPLGKLRLISLSENSLVCCPHAEAVMLQLWTSCETSACIRRAFYFVILFCGRQKRGGWGEERAFSADARRHVYSLLL